MDLTNILQNACTYANTNFDAAAWRRFIDGLVIGNQLDYSWDDADDTWINVMSREGEQVFFCGRNMPLLFVSEEYSLTGLDGYPHSLEIVSAEDWWTASYTVNLDELTTTCLSWHTEEIPHEGKFSLLDFVYATH